MIIEEMIARLPEYHKALIKMWFERSQTQEGYRFSMFDKLVSLWISFNALYSHTAGTFVDRDGINWIKREKDYFQPRFRELLEKNREFKDHLLEMTKYSIPHHPSGNKKSIKNIKNFGEIIEAIYQIRNNLFHGYKRFDLPEDQELVRRAFLILTELLGPVVKRM